MKIEWECMMLPGGVAFVACFLGQYGFGYDTRMKAYAKLVPALQARAAWQRWPDTRRMPREVVA